MKNFYQFLETLLNELDVLGLQPIETPSARSTHDLKQYQKEGQRYFVKFPTPIAFSEYSPDMQSIVEHLAYQIYRAFGVKVPQSYLVINQNKDTIGIATSGIQGKTAGSHLPLLGHKDINMGFFVDAFLANWDVIGLLYDNIMLADDGQAYRIDPGGALTYRAQGGRKGNKFGENPSELESLRNPAMSPQAGKVFSQMSKEQMAHAAQVFQSVPWTNIESIIISTKADALDKLKSLDQMKQQRLGSEIEQDFNEILAKLRVRYSKVVEFIQNMAKGS